MEGWRPVEDLVRWGFGQAPVVMANELHSGLARSVRTRVIGARMIRAAHEAGVRRLAMEALRPAGDMRARSRPFRRTPRATWPSRRCAADRHGAGPGLDPVGLRGGHRHHAGVRPGLAAQHGVHQLARAPAGREPGPADRVGARRADAGLVRQQPCHQAESRRMDPDGLALPRDVRHRPVRYRSDRDRQLRRPAAGVRELLESLADTLAALGGTAGILRARLPRRWTSGPASTRWSSPPTTS